REASAAPQVRGVDCQPGPRRRLPPRRRQPRLRPRHDAVDLRQWRGQVRARGHGDRRLAVGGSRGL
ncbi:MAG: hypothetical protein AVDCRST_MAG10-2563, partial [uncultured Acidimicrobiales bacterium]